MVVTGDAGDQYTGLDRFGRVVDQRWVKTADGSHTDRFQYGYDRNSNRNKRGFQTRKTCLKCAWRRADRIAARA